MRINVESSWLAAFWWKSTTIYAYPERNTGDLFMETKKGKVYVFADVPESVFEAWSWAVSKGQYYHVHIKDRYVCEDWADRKAQSDTENQEDS